MYRPQKNLRWYKSRKSTHLTLAQNAKKLLKYLRIKKKALTSTTMRKMYTLIKTLKISKKIKMKKTRVSSSSCRMKIMLQRMARVTRIGRIVSGTATNTMKTTICPRFQLSRLPSPEKRSKRVVLKSKKSRIFTLRLKRRPVKIMVLLLLHLQRRQQSLGKRDALQSQGLRHLGILQPLILTSSITPESQQLFLSDSERYLLHPVCINSRQVLAQPINPQDN